MSDKMLLKLGLLRYLEIPARVEVIEFHKLPSLEFFLSDVNSSSLRFSGFLDTLSLTILLY